MPRHRMEDLIDISLRSSIKSISSNMSIDPFDISDFSLSLRSEDLQLSGDLCALSSKEGMNYLSHIYEDLPLSDATATAADAMNDWQPTATRANPSSQQETISSASFDMSAGVSSEVLVEEYAAESNYLVAKNLSLFLDNHPSSYKDSARHAVQPSTSSSPLIPTKIEAPRPLPSSHNSSVSSSDWAKDFEGQPVDSGPLYPSLFMSNSSIASFVSQLSSASPPPRNVPQTSSQYEALPVHPSPNCAVTNNPPTASPTITSAQANVTPSPLNPIMKKKKRRKPRVLDETRVAEPTDNDVLFGRGPSINRHPGNVRFRQKALEFHSWYMESSKQQKEKITNLLVESVKPHRFLEKGEDKLWHEVIDGVHYKAS